MLKIRRVQATDIFPVIALAYDTLPERYNPSIFNQFYESFPEGFLIAMHNHILIGFLIGIKTTMNTARILMLSVNENNRRQGIGSALLKKFLLEMKNHQIRQIELEVRTTNRGAVEFYIKQGFILQEKLHHFYQNGEDAYSMRKGL
ncbi:putative N-acetyltransferase [uncultured archaeon]|nr:putative N-acetyltransferase [uncultured archaeon]